MAKGDDSRARNKVESEGDRGKQLGENLRTGTLEPAVRQFGDYFSQAAPRQMADYGHLMGGYNQFQETGGFSPQDIGSIRARAVSPIRSIYSRANQEVDRAKSLQGGYSPGYGTLKSRMARDMSSGISDATTNAEAAIAQMVQQGKLAGMQGGSSLYSASPGMAGTFGNQTLGAVNELSQGVGREMGFGQNIAGQQIQAGQLPGKFQSAMGNVSSVMGLGQQAAGMLYPWLNSVGPSQGAASGSMVGKIGGMRGLF